MTVIPSSVLSTVLKLLLLLLNKVFLKEFPSRAVQDRQNYGSQSFQVPLSTLLTSNKDVVFVKYIYSDCLEKRKPQRQDQALILIRGSL